MGNYKFSKVEMINWDDQTMINEVISYDLSTISYIDSKIVTFDYDAPRPALIIHFKTNQTATFDGTNWSIGFI